MEISQMAKIFKALSNEQRLKLFKMIYYWNQTINDSKGGCCHGVEKTFTRACDCMDLSRSTISHHIKELQSAGLIECKRNGQFFSCSVNHDVVEAIREFF